MRKILARQTGILLLLCLLVSHANFAQLTVNLALNKPATASTLETAAYPAGNATDGNPATIWSSGGSFAQWLYVDLGAFYDVQKVVLKWSNDRYASVLDIQVSNDGTQWSTIYTVNPNPAGEVTTITGISGIGRYVKFNGRGRGTGVRYRIAEFEVYGVTPAPPTPEQQAAIDDVTNKLITKIIPETVNDATVTDFSNSMLADGSWADIDYADKGETSWKPATHLNRLIPMALAYRTTSSTLYNSASLLAKIVSGIDFFYNRKPVSDNWWFNDIGGPQDYMIPLILLKGKIDRTLLLQYSSYLREQTVRFAGGGKNLTWIAEISIYKGCIEDDFRTVDIGFKAMASTLTIVPNQGDEGIKIDNSFHQHHEQLYTGGYGMSITSDLSNYIELTGGNLFADSFSAAKRKIFSDLLLKGHMLLGYRNVIDFGTMGRNISRPSSGKTNISPTVLDKMIIGDPANAAAYQAWKEHLDGALFPAVGNKHFWKSDIMAHHGANYYLSAKIISTRTLGTESLNGENIKAYNLPLGATNILTHSNEYNNIYPVWDWARIPGTTAEQSQEATALEGYIYGTNNFGGGVSNGKNGIMAYEHNYKDVQAKKAYFFMGDVMFCLGAGINANKANPVATSVNQSFLSGNITVNNGVATQTFTGTSENFENLKWVHHDNVGYIIPAGGNVTLQGTPQSGTWKSINGDGSSALVTSDVFSLWFNHGNAPSNGSYQYMVAPDKSLTEFQDFTSNHGFVVVRNDADFQAVKNENSGSYAIVFYNPGTVDMGNGMNITSDKKALVFLQKNANDYQLSVSDPLYNQTNVTITITGNPTPVNGRTAAQNVVSLITFPVGDYKGNTSTITIAGSALPVTLTDFSVKKELQTAILKWKTTQESNSSNFVIERSGNGKQFLIIGEVKASGNSSVLNDYSFTDANPENGNNYYRLRMVDLDGSFAYSKMVAIEFSGKPSKFELYPNPAANRIAIRSKETKTPFKVEVFSVTGKRVLQKSVNGITETDLDITPLLSGIYVMQISDGKETVYCRFVKE